MLYPFVNQHSNIWKVKKSEKSINVMLKSLRNGRPGLDFIENWYKSKEKKNYELAIFRAKYTKITKNIFAKKS